MTMSQVSSDKMAIVDSTVKLLDEYKLIGAADLTKVGSGMLQDLRKQLRGQVTIKGIKNTLMRISMEKVGLRETRGSARGPSSANSGASRSGLASRRGTFGSSATPRSPRPGTRSPPTWRISSPDSG
jgi:hypothetical protein